MLGAGRSFCFLQHTQHALRVNGNAPACIVEVNSVPVSWQYCLRQRRGRRS